MSNSKTSKGFANVSIKVCKYIIMAVIIIVCATAAYNFGTSRSWSKAGNRHDCYYQKRNNHKRVGEYSWRVRYNKWHYGFQSAGVCI